MQLTANDFVTALRSAIRADAEFVLDSVYDSHINWRDGDGDLWAVDYRVEDDRVVLGDQPELGNGEEFRKMLNAKARNALDDSDFAYIDSKGGRHLPVPDANHVRAALARFSQTNFESADAKKSAAKKILAAAKKFGVDVDDSSDVAQAARAQWDFEVQRRGRRQRRELQPSLEHRRVETSVEIRDLDKKGNTVTLQGTPIVYDTPYMVRDMFGEFQETMRPGVAADLLSSPNFNCRFLYDHKGMVMASSAAGTMRFEDTKRGLNVYPVIDTRSPSAMDLYIATERGDIRNMSIGFKVAPDGEKWDERQENREVFRFSDMPDVSAVAFPASTTTSIMVARSAFATLPPESRERVRKLYPIAKQIRSGQPLSQADGDLLLRAIQSLYEADDLDEETLLEAFRSFEGSGNKEDEEVRRQRNLLALAQAKARALAQ